MKRGKSTFKLDKLPPSGVRTGTSERASERVGVSDSEIVRECGCAENAHTHTSGGHTHTHTPAPSSIRHSITPSRPHLAARCKGVCPTAFCELINTLTCPFFPTKMSFTSSTLPSRAAMCSAVVFDIVSENSTDQLQEQGVSSEEAKQFFCFGKTVFFLRRKTNTYLLRFLAKSKKFRVI